MGGLEKASNEEPSTRTTPEVGVDRAEATLIATACSQVPEGHEHWTLRLLAGKMVELGVVERVSHETIRRTLKKRDKAMAEGNVVYSGGQCGLCGLHGRRTRSDTSVPMMPSIPRFALMKG